MIIWRRKLDYLNNKKELKLLFEKTFKLLNEILPHGIVRGNRKNITPIVLYEAVTVGVADALTHKLIINKTKLINILNDAELNKLTTGATNSKKKVLERIKYVKQNIV